MNFTLSYIISIIIPYTKQFYPNIVLLMNLSFHIHNFNYYSLHKKFHPKYYC